MGMQVRIIADLVYDLGEGLQAVAKERSSHHQLDSGTDFVEYNLRVLLSIFCHLSRDKQPMAQGFNAQIAIDFADRSGYRLCG